MDAEGGPENCLYMTERQVAHRTALKSAWLVTWEAMNEHKRVPKDKRVVAILSPIELRGPPTTDLRLRRSAGQTLLLSDRSSNPIMSRGKPPPFPTNPGPEKRK